MSSLKYRADIDGLRAVAVLGVVIYHAFPWALPGGFTGVDIFFVISGYLISGILYKGHLQGGFRFKEFYARRVRRLFPALITVLALTMAYGWLILLPDEYEQLGKHIAAGTLFIQNIVFWKESGYFDTAANLKPMLHLWSLAVEEQFYIFFPPLLLLIWKRKWPLAVILGVLMIASMIGNLVMSVQNSASDFFLTPYRAWEFLGGSLLAWWHYDKGHEEEVPLYREAFSWVGALLLILGMAFIQKEQAYPGWRALLPVAGTLLLMEGGRSSWVNREILSNPAVVWIGLISYPLYLFHWPALSFVHIVKGQDPPSMYLWEALGVSLLLAAITYHFIERKIRHNKSNYTLASLVAGFVSIGIFAMFAFNGKIKSYLSESILPEYAKASKEHNYFDDTKVTKFSPHIWLHEAGGNEKKTLYIGDSHMQQCIPRVLKLIKSGSTQRRGMIFLTLGGLLPVPGVVGPQKSAGEEMSRGILEYGTRSDVDRIVVAANWVYFFDQGGEKNTINDIPLCTEKGAVAAISSLIRTLSKFNMAGKKTYLILNTPISQCLGPKQLVQRNFDGSFQKINPTLQVSELENGKTLSPFTHGELMEKMKTAANTAGIIVINPMDTLSKDGFCLIYESEKPIYTDPHHLRSSYVRDHATYIDQTILP
jgi:peptidoglycan/LPS O-acetylase OafA/YrhL